MTLTSWRSASDRYRWSPAAPSPVPDGDVDHDGQAASAAPGRHQALQQFFDPRSEQCTQDRHVAERGGLDCRRRWPSAYRPRSAVQLPPCGGLGGRGARCRAAPSWNTRRWRAARADGAVAGPPGAPASAAGSSAAHELGHHYALSKSPEDLRSTKPPSWPGCARPTPASTVLFFLKGLRGRTRSKAEEQAGPGPVDLLRAACRRSSVLDFRPHHATPPRPSTPPSTTAYPS